MSVTYIEGDLFDCGVEAIGHGVNCKGVMGAGIAKVFKAKFPHMYVQYGLACDLGTLSPGGVFPWEAIDGEPRYFVFNIASQNYPGADARRLWLTEGLTKTLAMCERLTLKRLAVPRIGAGIGGLEWEEVKAIYEKVATEFETQLVVVSLPGA